MLTEVLTIFVKDLRRRRGLLVVLYGLLLVAVGWCRRLAETQELAGPDGPSSQLLPSAVAAAFLLLLVLVVQSDPPYRSDGTWLTKPLVGWQVLAAKSVFVVLCLLVPLVLAQLVMLHLLGLPRAALPAAAVASLGELVPFALLAMLLAALTADLARFAVLSLGAAAALAMLLALARWVFYLRWGSELGAHLLDGWWSLVLWMLSITAAGLLAHQYRTRQRRPVAGVAVLLALILALTVVPWTGGLFWVGPESHPPPSVHLAPGTEATGTTTPDGGGPGIEPSIRPSPLPDSSADVRRLELTAEVRQRPSATYYRALHAAFFMRYGNGRVVNPSAKSAGVVLGLEAALAEALATANPAGGGGLRWPTDLPVAQRLDLWVGSGEYDDLAGEEAALKGRLVVEERRLRPLGALPLEVGAELQRDTDVLRIVGLDRIGPFLTARLTQRRIEGLGASCDLWLLLEEPAAGATRILPPDDHSRFPQEDALPTPLVLPRIITAVSSPTFRVEGASAEAASRSPIGNQPLRLLPIQDCPVGRRSALVSERGFRMADYATPIRPAADSSEEAVPSPGGSRR